MTMNVFLEEVTTVMLMRLCHLIKFAMFLNFWRCFFFCYFLGYVVYGRRKYKLKYRTSFTVPYKGKSYVIRGLRKGRCTVKVKGRSRPIFLKGGRLYVRTSRGKKKRVFRYGNRRFILLRRRRVYLPMNFRIRFMNKMRKVIYRRRRWRIKIAKTYRKARKRLQKYIKRNGRMCGIKRVGRKTYLKTRRNRFKRVRVVIKRRWRLRRGKRCKS